MRVRRLHDGFVRCAALLLAGSAAMACDRRIVVGETRPPDAAPAETDARGLSGAYHDNVDLTGAPVLVRTDPALDLVWLDQSAPGPGLTARFSARWTGALEPPATGTFDLRLASDDGSRLWIDGRLVIDQWKGAPNAMVVPVELVAGRRVSVRAELYSVGGSASIKLSWTGPGVPMAVVPSDRLYPTP